MASSEEDIVIMEQVKEYAIEYGLKVNEKSKVVCINGEVRRHRWKMRDCYIGEVEECKYLGVTVKGGQIVVSRVWGEIE